MTPYLTTGPDRNDDMGDYLAHVYQEAIDEQVDPLDEEFEL